MKYIEELKPGEAFESHRSVYVMTTDFKRNGDRLGVDVKTGMLRWFGVNEIAESTDLYIVSDNNFSPINPREKNDSY